MNREGIYIYHLGTLTYAENKGPKETKRGEGGGSVLFPQQQNAFPSQAPAVRVVVFPFIKKY